MALRRKTTADVIFDILNYAAITTLSLTIIYPFFYVVINSFNPLLTHGPAYLFPSKFSLRSYQIIFSDDTIFNAFIMSVLRTVVGVVATVFVCSTCAFALRKRDLLFRNIFLIVFTIPMFFGGGLIPGYLNLRMLGLLNTFFVYILPRLFSFFFVIIFMSSFNDIPDSLEESAKMDGAGYFTIFFRIYFPLSLSVVATISLFAGVSQWNSWFDTLYFTRSPHLMTLAAVLMRIIKQSQMANYTQEMLKEMEKYFMNPEGVKLATMIVAIVPIMLTYPFLQRYFIKGVRIGSIKG